DAGSRVLEETLDKIARIGLVIDHHDDDVGEQRLRAQRPISGLARMFPRRTAKWQRDCEDGAAPRAGARRLHRSAMHLNEVLDNRETESQATVPAGGRG